MKLKPQAGWSDSEIARFHEFVEATAGVNAYTVARAMCFVTPGVDWRGCTKAHMAGAWVKGASYSIGAKRLHHRPIGDLRSAIATISPPRVPI